MAAVGAGRTGPGNIATKAWCSNALCSQAIRWLTTLLSREFNLADTIRLWDSLWTDTDRHTFLSYLCCAMIIEMREDILKGDFSENLCLLQAYPQSSSCDNLIALANQLRINDVKDDKMASIQKHEHLNIDWHHRIQIPRMESMWWWQASPQPHWERASPPPPSDLSR